MWLTILSRLLNTTLHEYYCRAASDSIQHFKIYVYFAYGQKLTVTLGNERAIACLISYECQQNFRLAYFY